MTEQVLRNMIVHRVQLLLPEVTDWNTLLRVMRIAGKGVNAEWNKDMPTDPVPHFIELGLAEYGEKTRAYTDEIELQWNAGEDTLNYRAAGIIEPELVYWRDGDEYRLLQKLFRRPIRERAGLKQGKPDYWVLHGFNISLTPVPDTTSTILIEGVLKPYIHPTTKTIHGVIDTDLPYVAQFIASYFIEGMFPQHAVMWRQEAQQVFLRRLKDLEWYQHRQRRGVRYGRR